MALLCPYPQHSATCFSVWSTLAKSFSWSRVLGEEHQVFPKNSSPGFKASLRISSGFCHLFFFSKHTSKAFHLDLEASSERSHDMACLRNSSPGFKAPLRTSSGFCHLFFFSKHTSKAFQLESSSWRGASGLPQELPSWFQALPCASSLNSAVTMASVIGPLLYRICFWLIPKTLQICCILAAEGLEDT